MIKLTRYLALRPSSQRAWCRRGVAYWQLGEEDLSLADHDQALRLRPGFMCAHYHRGWIMLRRDQQAEAIRDFSIAIQNYGKNNGGYLQRSIARRGVTYLIANQPEKARLDIARAQTMRPSRLLALALALARAESGQAAARPTLDELLPPGKGRILQAGEKHPVYARIATRLIKQLPAHPLAHAARGNVHFKLGNRRQATLDLERALALCSGERARYRSMISSTLDRARALPRRTKR